MAGFLNMNGPDDTKKKQTEPTTGVTASATDQPKKSFAGISAPEQKTSSFAGVNTTPKTTVQAPTVQAPTAYQANVSQPVQQWTVGMPANNYGQAVANIAAEQDPAKRQEKMAQLSYLSTQPTSKYYNPYTQPTNRAAATLQSYGVDTSKMTSEWFATNTAWQAGLVYNGTTNTPSKPGKGATQDQIIAYEVYQFGKAQADTEKATAEWTAMQEELTYWAGRRDLNLSDDEIIAKIDWSKYPTISKMQSSSDAGSPMELNSPVGYSRDAMYGTIWAARNDGGTGSSDGDIAGYYAGSGTQWEADPEIKAKLDITNLDTYSPYSVGMTGANMDKAGLYFGVSSFDRGWVEANRGYLASGDETAVKMYQAVASAEQTTQKAEEELAALKEEMGKKLARCHDPEKAKKWLDEHISDYPTLSKMDESLVTGKVLDMTRPVDYRKADMYAFIDDYYANPENQPNDVADTAVKLTGNDKFIVGGLQSMRARADEMDDMLAKAWDFLTADEQAQYSNVWSPDYDQAASAAYISKGQIMSGTDGGVYAGMRDDTFNAAHDDYMSASFQQIYALSQTGRQHDLDVSVQDMQEEYDYLSSKKAEIPPGLETLDIVDIDNLRNIMSSPRAEEIGARIASGDDMGYLVLYNEVHGVDDAVTPDMDQGVVEKAIAEGKAMWEAAMNGIPDDIEPLNQEEQDRLAWLEENLPKTKQDKDDLDLLISDSQSNYDAAVDQYAYVANMSATTGGIDIHAIDPEYNTSMADEDEIVLDYVTSIAFFDLPTANPYGFITGLSGNVEQDEEMCATELRNCQFILQEYGDSLPDGLREKLLAYEEYLNQNLWAYRYYSYTLDPEFDEFAAKEYDNIFNNGFNTIWESRFGRGTEYVEARLSMNERSRRIYAYLYAKEGRQAADDYLKFVEAGVQAEVKQGIQARAEERAKTPFGRLANLGISIVSVVPEFFGDVAYQIESIGGMDQTRAKWNRMFAYTSKAQTSSIMGALDEVYKDSPVMHDLVKGFYEIATNRGRSAVMAFTFGPVAGLTGSEIIAAFPIAFTAATDALEDAFDAGIYDWRAYAYAAGTFAAESVTEGIKFKNIRGNFADGSIGKLICNYLNEALPEIAGETINDIVETALNTALLGDDSDYAKAVRAYEADGMSHEDAEEAAFKDIVSSVLHTAIISAISPGMDVVLSGAGKAKRYFHDARLAGKESKATGQRVTVADIRAKREAAQNAPQATTQQTAAQPATTPQATTTTQQQPAGQTINAEQATDNANVQNTQQSVQPANTPNQYQVDLAELEATKGGNQESQTLAVQTVLTIDDGNKATAKAAATRTTMNADELGMLMIGGDVAGVDNATLKAGIQYAALADGESRRVVESDEYKSADYDVKAQMLATAAQVDAQNAGVQDQVQRVVHQSRVIDRAGQLRNDEGYKSTIKNAYAAIDVAANNAEKAQKKLNEINSDLEAASGSLVSINDEYERTLGDPSADNARSHLEKQKIDANERVIALKGQQIRAENDLNMAKTESRKVREEQDSVIEKANDAIRQQAEADVVAMEQQEAQARADEQARIQAEQEAAAKVQAEEDERTGKAWEDRRDDLIEKILDEEYLEEGERREQRRQELTERANMIRAGKIDTAGLMNNSEGLLAVGMLGRRLGVEVKLTNDAAILPDGAAGKYENGVVYLNNNMIQSGKMTIGQALVEVALHEYTHYMQGTKAYGKYKQTVLDFLFQGDEVRQKAAIDSKIADYKEKFGQNLTTEGAIDEIVADFARTRLNDRDVVQRFIDNGLAGKIRNALHNINQAIKNFRLKGTERETAEYLRRTERLYQKMIEEAARSSVHPDGGQFSIAQLADAVGLEFDQNTLEMHMPDGQLVDGISDGGKITPDMIRNTPIGMLISLAETGVKNKKGKVTLPSTISAETAQAQRQMFADLANMCAQYKDSNLVWEIASSTLFSAMKSNSDPQYSTTVDFGTICAKTQEIINVMSRVMLEKGRGLTRNEVLKVYNETAKAELTVPCPVCYVFSRWMGVPSLLGQMSQYQKRFVKMNSDGKSIDVAATQKAANDYIKAALAKYGDKDGIDDAKTSLMNRMKTQEKNRTEALKVILSETATEKEKAAAQAKHDKAVSTMDSLTAELGEVEAFNWVTQALCKQERKGKKVYNVLDADGNYVVDSAFELTPDDVLFDLRRTGDFAKFTKNWSYRNTRGAGMGKAIMPYSGESIGDIIYGTTRKMASANPFQLFDPKTAAKGMKDAIARAVKQNLIGGQRLQSTSDFRPEWGLDYMMSFLELQAIGSKVQMYTKVAEAVPLLASMGADINLSIMGKGKGWHIDENGNYVLDFSDVTGMKYETAKNLKDQYSNVQMILVGMNDTHIRLALADTDIDFVIPWHSSGNSKDTLASLVSSASTGKEQLETSSDYTDTQSDKESENQTPEQKRLWDLRMKILQMQRINAEERDIIYHDEYLSSLYERFNVEGKDADCYHVKLGKDQAKQIFPYEYWNKSLNKEQADENGKAFVDYCLHFGITPRFSGVVRSAEEGKYFTAEDIGDGRPIAYDANGHVIRYVQNNFAGAVYDENGNITGYDPAQMDKGYWKVLIDRPMYDNDGNYRDQQVVDVTKAKIGKLENGKLTGSDMPLTTSAMYGPAYSTKEKNAVDNALAAINEQSDLRGAQYSDGGASLTDFDNPEYMKPFAEQLHDFAPKETRDEIFGSDSLLVGGTPKLLKDIGFPALPVVINQEHVGYALDGTYPKEKYRKGHIFTESEFAKLPDKIADPVAVTYDPKRPNAFIIYVDMVNTEGDKVIVPIQIGATRNIGGNAYDTNVLRTVFEQENGAQMIASAINNDSANRHTLFYLNKEKTLNLNLPHDIITIVQKAKSGINHIINAPGSLVNTDIKHQTDTNQFKRWFSDSKVKDGNDKPISVYHWSDSNERFSTFTPGERGEVWFSNIENSVYNNRPQVYEDYLKIENPYTETNYVGADSNFDPVSVVENGRHDGHDGAIVSFRLDPEMVNKTINTMEKAGLTDILATDSFGDNFTFLPHGEERANLAKDGETLIDFMKRGASEDLYQYYVVYNPTQIKSATDNIGMFDENNPNSQYSDGGTSLTELDQHLVDSGVITQEDLDAYQRSITNPFEGENPLATSAGEGEERAFGNGMLQESNEIEERAKQYALAQNKYFPDTNAEQIERAIAWIRSNKATPNSDGLYEAIQKVVNNNFDYRSADGQARMVALMGMAVAKGDTLAQTTLVDAFNRQGTDLGRALQARKLFRMMTPTGRISTIQKMIDAEQAKLDAKGVNVELKFSDWIYQAASAATEEGDFQKVQQAAARELAAQLPASWVDKLRGWRMLSMLGNPRTHIRNVIGNALFIPAVSMKNKIGAIGEMFVRDKVVNTINGREVIAENGDITGYKLEGFGNSERTDKAFRVTFKNMPNESVVVALKKSGAFYRNGSWYLKNSGLTNEQAEALIKNANAEWMEQEGISTTKTIKAERTKTLAPVLNKVTREFARQDAETMKAELTGEAKYNEDTMTDRERKTFKGLLQILSDFNSGLLESEDWFFLKGHYRRALGGWMQANGYTAADMRAQPELLEQGRAYAIQEAQKATYRDFNGLAKKLNDLVRNPQTTGQKVLAFGVEAVLPFKKTPANILKRGLEYSPVGIAKALTTDMKGLINYMRFQNGTLKVMPDNAVSPTEFIDHICSGLAGTAIMAIGGLLSNMGIVSCGFDDDDEFEKERGGQQYAIRLNLFGHDVTYTLDWAAPMSMPFFVGAAIQEMSRGEGATDLDGIINAISGITEPVFNLSMLDGVNSLLKVNTYNSESPIASIAAKVAANYATSYVPSLLGAAARINDPYRRKAFVDSESGKGVTGTFRYALEQIENKIPGLSQSNIPYRDIWGNPETSSSFERHVENLLSPGYYNEYRDDPILDEMERVYNATGDSKLVPSDPPKTITVKGQKTVLTAEQWDTYKVARGQTAHELLSGLMETPEYLKASETIQAEMIDAVWSYADQVGKNSVVPSVEVDDLGDDPVATIAKQGAITGYKGEMMKAIEAGDWEAYDAMVEALREAGATDTEIRTKIANKYRDLYKAAYRADDYERMEEIEEILDNTGFKFDVSDWEEQVDGQND